jgi:hypothetical protein
MANYGGSPTVTNCTFAGNAAGYTGGGMYSYGNTSNPTVTNSILWNNVPNDVFDDVNSTTTAAYSDIAGGFPGTGNIDADPLFVDPDHGDLRLQPGSPCIDAGDNTAVPVAITTDLDGNPRFTHDPCTIDTGNPDGTNPPVDMGAYELQPSCPADLDCSGEVDVGDLIAIILAWGSCEGCPEDLDGDDTVAVGDLIIVLLAWGPCS